MISADKRQVTSAGLPVNLGDNLSKSHDKLLGIILFLLLESSTAYESGWGEHLL